MSVFLERYGHLDSRFTTALQAQDWDALYQLNHALKGVAGNLAMTGVAQVTEQIEPAFHQQQEKATILLLNIIGAVECVESQIKLLLALPESL